MDVEARVQNRADAPACARFVQQLDERARGGVWDHLRTTGAVHADHTGETAAATGGHFVRHRHRAVAAARPIDQEPRRFALEHAGAKGLIPYAPLERQVQPVPQVEPIRTRQDAPVSEGARAVEPHDDSTVLERLRDARRELIDRMCRQPGVPKGGGDLRCRVARSEIELVKAHVDRRSRTQCGQRGSAHGKPAVTHVRKHVHLLDVGHHADLLRRADVRHDAAGKRQAAEARQPHGVARERDARLLDDPLREIRELFVRIAPLDARERAAQRVAGRGDVDDTVAHANP